jgi:type I restriction-modification system DNA methylase subunit
MLCVPALRFAHAAPAECDRRRALKQEVCCLLYGQEINPETYAVCKANMLLKGEAEAPTTS